MRNYIESVSTVADAAGYIVEMVAFLSGFLMFGLIAVQFGKLGSAVVLVGLIALYSHYRIENPSAGREEHFLADVVGAATAFAGGVAILWSSRLSLALLSLAIGVTFLSDWLLDRVSTRRGVSAGAA